MTAAEGKSDDRGKPGEYGEGCARHGRIICVHGLGSTISTGLWAVGWNTPDRRQNTASQDVSIDPAVAAAAAGPLIGIVLMAAWLPARRAARIDPTLALKAQ